MRMFHADDLLTEISNALSDPLQGQIVVSERAQDVQLGEVIEGKQTPDRIGHPDYR